jgi:hypothetical protein
MIAFPNSSSKKHCGVCGCESLQIDEVAHQGRMLLAQCSRCQHRWTEALPDYSRGRRSRPRRVIASSGASVAASRNAGRAEAA